MRRLISVIFNVLMCLIILTSLSYLISAEQVKENPEHIPSVMGFAPLTVVSGSMSPQIKTGDMVIIRIGEADIKPGDIITYRLGDILVTHRVKNKAIGDVAEAYITQGDANEVPDYQLVSRSQIVGKCVFTIPMGGYIKAALRGLPGILIIVGLFLIVIMTEVLNWTKLKLREI